MNDNKQSNFGVASYFQTNSFISFDSKQSDMAGELCMNPRSQVKPTNSFAFITQLPIFWSYGGFLIGLAQVCWMVAISWNIHQWFKEAPPWLWKLPSGGSSVGCLDAWRLLHPFLHVLPLVAAHLLIEPRRRIAGMGMTFGRPWKRIWKPWFTV